MHQRIEIAFRLRIQNHHKILGHGSMLGKRDFPACLSFALRHHTTTRLSCARTKSLAVAQAAGPRLEPVDPRVAALPVADAGLVQRVHELDVAPGGRRSHVEGEQQRKWREELHAVHGPFKDAGRRLAVSYAVSAGDHVIDANGGLPVAHRQRFQPSLSIAREKHASDCIQHTEVAPTNPPDQPAESASRVASSASAGSTTALFHCASYVGSTVSTA